MSFLRDLANFPEQNRPSAVVIQPRFSEAVAKSDYCVFIFVYAAQWVMILDIVRSFVSLISPLVILDYMDMAQNEILAISEDESRYHCIKG